MISILLVDDDNAKAAAVEKVVYDCVDAGDATITRVRDGKSAMDALAARQYDLMVLDLNLPARDGEPPSSDGGIRIVHSLSRKTTGALTPVHIVGLTAVPELLTAHGGFFVDRTWSLLEYSAVSDAWIHQIGRLLIHIAETKLVVAADVFDFDLAVVTALHHVELEAVLALPGEWRVLPSLGEEVLFQEGTFQRAGKKLRVVAAAAPEMGMPAATATTMNIIQRFRPRHVAMVGIAAGIKGNYGDILVATHSWDYGCGKIRHINGRSEFLPAPSQIAIDALMKSKISVFCMEQNVLRRIQAEWSGEPAPSTQLSVHIGPVASGAAVLENEALVDEIKKRDAKVIGVEMETYGVFMAARMSREPRPTVTSFKSICDFGVPGKNDDYQRYAAYTSATFLYEFGLAFL